MLFFLNTWNQLVFTYLRYIVYCTKNQHIGENQHIWDAWIYCCVLAFPAVENACCSCKVERVSVSKPPRFSLHFASKTHVHRELWPKPRSPLPHATHTTTLHSPSATMRRINARVCTILYFLPRCTCYAFWRCEVYEDSTTKPMYSLKQTWSSQTRDQISYFPLSFHLLSSLPLHVRPALQNSFI